MAVSFITPLICSFVTIMAVALVLSYRKSCKLDPNDRSVHRMYLFSVILLVVFLVGTVYAYLSSFGVV